MNITLSQLLTAAHIFRDYEDDYDPDQPVVFTAVDGSLPADVRVDLDGAQHRITPSGQSVSA